MLLFPAVAALHGIAIAALHVDGGFPFLDTSTPYARPEADNPKILGAIDMDVYGAFQLCSIGIMTAPITVRRSRTYFYDPGRNLIFLWTGLIFAGEPMIFGVFIKLLLIINSPWKGLLSLAVEFFRANPTGCPYDDSGDRVSHNPSKFPYKISCGLTCDDEQGPDSPMRHGSASNINVIPAPDKLTFSTATLFAAACCIPAILSLIFMWDKIVEVNWKTSFGGRRENERIHEPIEGTNGATIGKMRSVNELVRKFLSIVEVPVFGAVVLAILVMGERNFFSSQVMYETEPIASIGRWQFLFMSMRGH